MDNLKNYWKQEIENSKDHWYLKPSNEVVNIIKNNSSGRILDIGCGLGRHTVFLAKNGFDVVAFDASQHAVDYTNKWLKEENTKAKVYYSDFLSWDYKQNEYDFILSINSFHHTTKNNVKMLCEKIVKSLKNNGVFLINVPNLKSVKKSHKKIEEQVYVPTSGSEKNMPHFYFKKEDFFDFFPNCEIKIKEVKIGSDNYDHYDVAIKKIVT